MKIKSITVLLIFVIAAELAGAVSALVAGGNFGAYYDTLIKPPLAPPGWLFPVMWSILYALMGISAYLIYSSEHISLRFALLLWGIQLFVNILWSPVFFGLGSFGGAVAVVIVMLALIIAMIAVFFRINRCAALLQLPYLAWTLFATYLSVGFYVLNT